MWPIRVENKDSAGFEKLFVFLQRNNLPQFDPERGTCHMSYGHFHDEMLARGVTEETLDTIRFFMLPTQLKASLHGQAA